MSQRKAIARFGPRPAQPGQLREILREIARWAVASTLTASAGCSALTDTDLGQDVPGSAGSSASMSGGAGSGVASTGSGGGDGAVTVPGAAGMGAPGSPSPGTPGPVTPTPGTPTPVTPTTHVGAGSGAPPPEPPVTPAEPTDWMPLPCTASRSYLDLTTGLALEPGADYAGLFRRYGEDEQGAPIVDAYSATGTPCSAAGAGSDCLERFDELRLSTPTCSTDSDCATFLLVTRGDEPARAAGPTEILAALGAIDTTTDAALAAFLDGTSMYCGTAPGHPTEVRVEADGYGVRTPRDQCGEGLFLDTLHVADDGTVTFVSTEKVGPTLCAIGRRPEGLHAAAPHAAGARIGVYLSAAARLEAASVVAFERLARELERHGAPGELAKAARCTARDEVRHTHSVAALALRFGGAFDPPVIEPERARSRFAMALENAVEGCVRETYGALVAHHQALSARDPMVRDAMRVIAEDESRHAELSWCIARWLEPQLGAAEQHALGVARSAALAQLFAERDPGLSSAELLALGMPDADGSAVLLTRLGEALGVG